MVPQIDRQLVFGAYAGMDSSSLGHAQSHVHDMAANWDLGMNNMTGFAAEPTSAWFMPFNMDLPDLGTDAEFGSVGSAGVGYGMGVMPVNNQADLNGMGGNGET